MVWPDACTDHWNGFCATSFLLIEAKFDVYVIRPKVTKPSRLEMASIFRGRKDYVPRRGIEIHFAVHQNLPSWLSVFYKHILIEKG